MEYVPKRYNTSYFENSSNQNKSILVGILDTGVDPLAYGLTKCPDGSNKIVDIVDCTGSDIVNTSTIKTLESLPQKVKDLIGSNITNPNEIFYGTRSLRTFLSDREMKSTDDKQKKVIENTILCVFTYKYNDLFVTVVETEDQIFKMNEYHIAQECGSINLQDGLFLNFGIHVYDNGKKTSVVTDTGSHATHCAGIIAGYFPDHPEYNGINPNAKILSLKIGDSRVDGMETSEALCRALEEMVKHECNLANYSFGESVCPTDSKSLGLGGRFIEMLEEYSVKHNVIFVTSAGNSGPTLMTVGAPRMCTEASISVGAYTDQALLNDTYFFSSNEFKAGPYDWSSRGPLFNRSMGVDIMAPGVALTSHPQWYKSNMNMCNGTSMACPNAVGIISLMLQNYKNNGSDLPFYWVKKYIENSSTKINLVEHFSQGHGLVFNEPVSKLKRIREDNYCYDIKSELSKKHIGELIKINANEEGNNDGIYIHNILISIEPKQINTKKPFDMVSFRKILSCKSNLNSLPHCKLDIPQNFVIDARGKTIRAQLRINLKEMTEPISEYIEFYEDDNNFVAYYPINIVKYVNIVDKMNLNFNVNAGKINRYYFSPLKNNMEISIPKQDTYGLKFVFVDVAKLTDVMTYRDGNRISENTIQKHDFGTKKVLVQCTPGSVYELVVYISWSAGTSFGRNSDLRKTCENIDLNLNCFNTNVFLKRNLLQIGDYDFAEVYCDDQTRNLDKTFTVENIVSKYFPISEQIQGSGSIKLSTPDNFCPKIDSVLELKYTLNSHIGKNKYYVDFCNKVYNSDVRASACIFGFLRKKLMFMGNYAQKPYDGTIDEIVIKISDTDPKRLEQYYGLILNVKRDLPKRKEISTFQGDGIIKLSLTKEMLKDSQLYYNDVIECKVINQYIHFINKSKPKEQEKTQDDVNSKLIEFWKTFKPQTIKENMIKFDASIKNESGKITFDNFPLYSMLNNLISTTPVKKAGNVGSSSANVAHVASDKQKFFDLLKMNKLHEKAPYCAYRYLWRLTDPTEVTIDDAMESLDCIEKKLDYWTDMSNVDITEIKLKFINENDTENKHIAKKRRLQYIIESEYGY